MADNWKVRTIQQYDIDSMIENIQKRGEKIQSITTVVYSPSVIYFIVVSCY